MAKRVVVITGSSRGIGRGLAAEFLRRNCEVVVSGRTDQSVAKGLETLHTQVPGCDPRIRGVACEVTEPRQVQRLWDASCEAFGRVDIWINNAGIIGETPTVPVVKMSAEDLRRIVDVNLTGSLYGSKVALAGMQAQGSGQLYNFEGFGSNGKMFRTGLTPYGATKVAIRYLSRALAKEVADTSIVVGTINPGIVVTDLLLAPYRDKPKQFTEARRIFNILADRVEDVTPFIVDGVLRKQPHIDWLPGWKVMGRFAMAPFRKRELFAGIEL